MPPSNDFSPFSLSSFSNQLIQSGYVTLPQMQQGLIEAQKSNCSLLEILEQITGSPLPLALLGQYKKQQLFTLKILHGVNFLDLANDSADSKPIAQLVESVIPYEFCHRYHVLPLKKLPSPPGILVAMVNPSDRLACQALQQLLQAQNLEFQRVGITDEDFEQAIAQYVGPSATPLNAQEPLAWDATIVDRTEVFEVHPHHASSFKAETPLTLEPLDSAQTDPIINLVNRILMQAVARQACQLHLEPRLEGLSLRYRQEKDWHPLCNPLPNKVADAIVARLKQMADINPACSQQPQNGRFRKVAGGRPVDFLVDVLPSPQGETITLRLFDSSEPPLTLTQLLPDESLRSSVEAAVRRPSGLFIVSAPTQAERSTLLYGLLSAGDRQTSSAVTVEDPLFRPLSDITQIEVNLAAGMTYQAALQSLERQDVDVVMLDRLESADIARQALELASRGCLVLAGVTAQDAASAITHLAQMVTPKRLAEMLVGALHQYPIRHLCPTCRLLDDPSPLQLAKFGILPEQKAQATFYRANALTGEALERAQEKGRLCRQCNGAGYWGELSLSEMLLLTPSVRQAIASGDEAATLRQAARQAGMKPTVGSGAALVLAGQTTFEELERIFAHELTVNPMTAMQPLSNNDLTERLAQIETLLAALTREVQQLKQDLQSSPVVLTETPAPAASPIYEELKPAPDWKTFQRDFDPAKETIADVSSLYEELTDPGEWDDLKRELEVDKATIAADFSFGEEQDDFNPFKSIADPWAKH